MYKQTNKFKPEGNLKPDLDAAVEGKPAQTREEHAKFHTKAAEI